MTTSPRTLLLFAGTVTLAACIRTAATVDAGAPDGTCIHTCTPDPGSGPVNCATEEAGLEFFPHPIVDFDFNGVNYGRYMYTYFDGTSTATPAGYDSRLVAVPAGRCAADPTNVGNNHVLHITGGPFLGWGGGMGVAMEHLSQDEGLCLGSPLPAYCPPPSAGDAVSHETLDLSQWDGVAVWARRGPDSQPLLRVLVGNKDTDDDISYWTYEVDKTLPRNCERVRECSCNYQNLACTFFPDPVTGGGGYYCGAPGAAPGPAIMAPASSTGMATNTCNTTRCNDPYSAYPNGLPGSSTPVPDPQFGGRPCTPYAFRNGVQSSFCFDPATDPPPAEPDQQCGDHWTAPLELTTDWHLFKVPFSTMFQQGFAKRFRSFDLKSISVVRLTWDAGYIDYWIDDLRFYRNRR